LRYHATIQVATVVGVVKVSVYHEGGIEPSYPGAYSLQRDSLHQIRTWFQRKKNMRFSKNPRGETYQLLIALVGLLVVYPHMEKSGAGQLTLVILVSVVLIAGVYATSRKRRTLYISLGLFVPALVVGLLFSGTTRPGVQLLVMLLQLAFFAFLWVSVLAFVLRPGRVTLNKISGALCVYLLLGLSWSKWYQIQELMRPGSFNFIGEGAPTWSDLIYFSYVTLTTLGYGDITPASSYARSAAMLEAMTGSLYLAILIARLVSLYGTEAAGDRDKSS
jgi:hypothetical protein